MPTTVETVRDALVQARRGRSLIETATLPVPETLADGLAAQAAVGRALGLAEAGWKVGIAEDGTPITFETRNVPCKTNPLGLKGAGEAGAIGSCPALVNAIIDALWREYNIDHIDMPATPERVWMAIREHQRRHRL